MFELVEEALDEIALLVEVGVIGALDLAIAFWRDDGFGADLGDSVDEMVGVIALVGDLGLSVSKPSTRSPSAPFGALNHALLSTPVILRLRTPGGKFPMGISPLGKMCRKV